MACGNHLTSDLGDLFWGVTRENYQRVKGTILLGVGWWKYQGRPSQEVCDVLKTTLNPKYCHSVRDNYTFQMLEHAGIGNILVTGCPTLWNLTPTHCEGIPSEKADAVLFTFSSDYAKHPERDHTIFRILKKQYRDMYFWPQGPEDIHYINDFDFKGEMLHANVGALHQFLVEHDNVDYVGTRLHAGVKALQQRRRSFIIAIDNRAAEKKTDFNLPVIDDVRDLEKAIVSKRPCRIKLPQEAICQWKSQFAA